MGKERRGDESIGILRSYQGGFPAEGKAGGRNLKRALSGRGQRPGDMAARTGCGRILAVPGFLDRSGAEEFHRLADTGDKKALYSYMNEVQGIQSMCQGLARLSDYGKKKEVKVTVEDFDDYTSPLSRTYGISWFLEQVPDLGFTFDMGNFAYMQEDIWEAWEKN